MKRTLYAAGVLVLLAFSCGAVQAQSNIGGDLDWPKTPVIDENTPQYPPTQQPRRQRTPNAGGQPDAGSGGQGQSAGPGNQADGAGERSASQRRPSGDGGDNQGAARPNRSPQPGAAANNERERPASTRRQAQEPEDGTAGGAIPPVPSRAVRAAVATPGPVKPKEAAAPKPAPAAPEPAREAVTARATPPAEPADVLPEKAREPLPEPTVPQELQAARTPEPAPALTGPEDVVPVRSQEEAEAAAKADETPAAAPAAPEKEETAAAAAPQPAPAKTEEPVKEAAASPAATDPAMTPPSAPDAAASPALLPPPPAPDPRLGKLIGQMIMVGFDGLWPDETGAIASQIKSGRIGGVLFTPRNIQSPTQTRGLTSAFRNLNAEIVPLLAIAQEGGSLHTLSPEKGFQPYPPASELGMGNDPLKAYALYQRMAAELSYYGFNTNMGPVLDLYHGDPKNISDGGGHSYGTQPKHVAAFAKAFRLAHAEQNVLTVLKHFPGDASDQAKPGWELTDVEPYRDLVVNDNADIVMAGHFVHPDISAEPGLPASLSPKAVKTLLREEIGYQGVVITDDLDAPEVAGKFSLQDRVVRAIGAGSDIVLFGDRAAVAPDLPDRVAGIIRNALAAGTLTRARLDESYSRIIALKQRLTGAGKAIAAAKDDADRSAAASSR